MSSSDDDSNSTTTLKQREKTISANTIKILKEFGIMMAKIPISVFTAGVLGLYLTKIAQANILPTDGCSAPFTSKICDINPESIYYNFLSHNDITYGQSMEFDHGLFLDTYKTNSIMCWIKNNAEKARHTPNALNFFYKILKNGTCFNNYLINTFFYGISGLPEIIIMIICGIGWHFIFIAFLSLNFLSTGYYCISNLSNSFSQTPSEIDIDKTYSKDNNDGFLLKWGFKCAMWFMTFVVTWFTFMGGGAMLFTINALLVPFFVRYKKSNGKGNKYTNNYGSHEGFWEFLKDILYFKKIYFLFLTLCSLMVAFVQVGGGKAAVPIACVALIVLMMGYLQDKSIANEIVENIDGTGFTKIDDLKIKQSVISKTCKQTFEPCDKKDTAVLEECKDSTAGGGAGANTGAVEGDVELTAAGADAADAAAGADAADAADAAGAGTAGAGGDVELTPVS